MSSSLDRVRIVAVPPGEAPLWVREKWVGLELPLAQPSAPPLTKRAAGVLSGSGTRSIVAAFVRCFTVGLNRERGFAVEVSVANQILERTSPEAAAWLPTNAPHLFRSGRCFLFPEEVCEVVP
jgi:hypothetical protein